jgi:hypothetical protein
MKNCLLLYEPDLQISNMVSKNQISGFILVQTALVEHPSQKMEIFLGQNAAKKVEQ